MNGRVSTRYEIGHFREGLIDTATTRREAFDRAIDWASGSTGYDDPLSEVRVFDSMAKVDQPESWATKDGNNWYPIRFKATT